MQNLSNQKSSLTLQKIVNSNSMKKIYLLLASFILSLGTFAQIATITVSNPEKVQRQEVVEVDIQAVCTILKCSPNVGLVVKNALNQEVAYQITYDGKLLIDASVRPSGTAVFTVEQGTPAPMKNFVHGAYHPERVDDIAWENDRGAYRLYGPALQASGEQAFGNDVWVKNTPDLEVDKRYSTEHAAAAKIVELRKQGKTKEAFDLEVATTYHFDHGYGLDCYKVGPSLGCGTPAILDNKSIKYPYCYKEYKILDNGPLRFTVELTYNPETLGKSTYVEHRLMSLDKGSNFNKQTVWYEGFTKPYNVCTGIVIHAEEMADLKLAADYVAYADPTDNPTKQNFQIYTGVVFTDKVKTELLTNGTNSDTSKGIAGHAVGYKTIKPNDKFTYYFGSAWSKYDVRNFNEWQARINTFIGSINQPLTVSVK